MPKEIIDNTDKLIKAAEEIYGSMFKGIENGKVILVGHKEADMNLINEKVKKIEKKEKILSIATLTDQLNLMAGILAEQIEAKQESERTELEKKALQVYKTIQDILNSDNV